MGHIRWLLLLLSCTGQEGEELTDRSADTGDSDSTSDTSDGDADTDADTDADADTGN
jgi:hypothetical protein